MYIFKNFTSFVPYFWVSLHFEKNIFPKKHKNLIL